MRINCYFCKPICINMDALSKIRKPVETELECYKKLFDGTLQHQDDYLGSALRHVAGRKGKMMRPILVLLVAKGVGEVKEPTLHAAVTLELLHTASLVHDDVVDESNRRRGQASVNAIYDNKVAVLVGDYLLSSSLHQAALTGDVRCVDLIARLGRTLSEGEVLQLANIRNEDFSEEAYFRIIRGKTAALFTACAELGALTAGATPEYTVNARNLGEAIGICFQIRDDIFDYYEDVCIGKPTGNDMREGKLTLPAIYALTHVPEPEMLSIASRVKEGAATDGDIARLIDFSKREGGIEYARSVMERQRKAAVSLLSAFPAPGIRQALQDYLDFVIGREI